MQLLRRLWRAWSDRGRDGSNAGLRTTQIRPSSQHRDTFEKLKDTLNFRVVKTSSKNESKNKFKPILPMLGDIVILAREKDRDRTRIRAMMVVDIYGELGYLTCCWIDRHGVIRETNFHPSELSLVRRASAPGPGK